MALRRACLHLCGWGSSPRQVPAPPQALVAVLRYPQPALEELGLEHTFCTSCKFTARGRLATDPFSCHNGVRALLASGGRKPGLLLSNVQGTGQPPAMNLPAPNTNAEVEKPDLMIALFLLSRVCIYLPINVVLTEVELTWNITLVSGSYVLIQYLYML